MLPPPPMPALLNNRWILSVSWRAATSSRNRSTCAASDTSATCVVMRKPCGSRAASQSPLVSAIAGAERSHIATLQPSATSCRTSSRPIPVPPPVTTANRPAKSFIAHASVGPLVPGLRVVYILLQRISTGLIRTRRGSHSLIDEQRRPAGGPMSKPMITAAFAAILAAGTAMAEAQTVTNHLLPGQLRVSELTGAPVYDNQNKNVGTIKDVVLDPDGRVAAVVLNVKGTLGLSQRYVAVGIGDLKITDTNAKPHVTVDLLKDQLRTAQTYDLHEAKL